MEVDKRSTMPWTSNPGTSAKVNLAWVGMQLVYSRKEEPNPMAPMGVSPPIGLTNHGGVEPLGLLCVECYSFE